MNNLIWTNNALNNTPVELTTGSDEGGGYFQLLFTIDYAQVQNLNTFSFGTENQAVGFFQLQNGSIITGNIYGSSTAGNYYVVSERIHADAPDHFQHLK